MTVLAFTPGEGGSTSGKPEPEESQQDRPSSRLPVQNRRQPVLVPPDSLDRNEDAVGSRERLVATLNNGRSVGQGSGLDSGKQSSTGDSQAEIPRTSNDAKGETTDKPVLRDIEEVEGNGIDPVRIEAQIAAQHNPLLCDIRFFTEHEGIPVLLQGNTEACLRLFGDFGIDEENDAEARDYLEHITNGGSYEKHKDDPLNAAWQETLTAYELSEADTKNEVAKAAFHSKLKAYKALVEDTFGVEFTHDESDRNKDTSWRLLGIRMAHVAFEEMARALGIAVRDFFGLHWDDATAFRRTIGKITLHNSTKLPEMVTNEDGTETNILKGIAQVSGTEIVVYWKENHHRNFYLLPNTVLHELGHILNANGAFGANQFNAWFNLLEDHPGSREGMGAPDADVLIGNKVIYRYQSEIILPTLAQDIGIWDPDHVIFDELRGEFPTQIQSLQQSTEDTPNEITADAKVNWVKHLITGGRFGFTNDEKGLNWQRIMDSNMDEQIRNSIAHIALKDERNLAVFIENGMLPEIRGRGTIFAGTNIRPGPSTTDGLIDSTIHDTDVKLFGFRDVPGWEDPWIAVWYEGNIRWVYGQYMRTDWDERLPISVEEASLNFENDNASPEDARWIQQLAWS